MRSLNDPPVASHTSPASASIERSLCAGIKSKPPTLVAETVMLGPKPPAPKPSVSTLAKIVAGPCPPVGFSYVTMTLPPFGPGPTAIPPKLPVADGIACCGLKGPQTPRPVTGAPRATMLPLEFQSTQTLPLPTAIDG